ncbi:MAG: hypothetical protein RLZZ297_1428 [Chloroflexota bacterium]|jgi:protein AroM
MPRIGAILIGQSPRPDLVKPLSKANPNYQYIESGALDFVDPAEIPAPTSEYILTTRLADGTLIRVDESYLFPLLRLAIANAERQGALLSVLLCAGPFDGLSGAQPVYRPTAMVDTILSTRGIKRIAVLSPSQEQASAIHHKWLIRGYVPTVFVDPGLPDAELAQWLREQLHYSGCEYLVVDYVGHPIEKIQALERTLPIPVLDLGKVITDMLRHVTT